MTLGYKFISYLRVKTFFPRSFYKPYKDFSSFFPTGISKYVRVFTYYAVVFGNPGEILALVVQKLLPNTREIVPSS